MPAPINLAIEPRSKDDHKQRLVKEAYSGIVSLHVNL